MPRCFVCCALRSARLPTAPLPAIGDGLAYTRNGLREVSKLIAQRHGRTVPYTDDAGIHAEIAANHFRYNDPLTVEEKLRNWCSLRIPDMRQEEVMRIIVRNTVLRGYKMTADAVAERLNVTYAERAKLRLTTIGSIDVDKHGREVIQKEKKKLRDRECTSQKTASSR